MWRFNPGIGAALSYPTQLILCWQRLGILHSLYSNIYTQQQANSGNSWGPETELTRYYVCLSSYWKTYWKIPAFPTYSLLVNRKFLYGGEGPCSQQDADLSKVIFPCIFTDLMYFCTSAALRGQLTVVCQSKWRPTQRLT